MVIAAEAELVGVQYRHFNNPHASTRDKHLVGQPLERFAPHPHRLLIQRCLSVTSISAVYFVKTDSLTQCVLWPLCVLRMTMVHLDFCKIRVYSINPHIFMDIQISTAQQKDRKAMTLRKFHKALGLTLSLPLLLVSTTGLVLLGRKDNIYVPETKRLLVRLHTWEILAKYSGSVMAIGLMTMVGTGLVLALRPELKKMRYRREIKFAKQRKVLKEMPQPATEGQNAT